MLTMKVLLRLPALIFCLPVVFFLVGMLLIGTDDLASAIGMGFGLLLYVINLVVFRCPQCGKSPYLRVSTGGAFRRKYSLPWPEKACSRCGYHFARSSTETSV